MFYYYQIRTHHYKTEAVPAVTCPLCKTTGGLSMDLQQKYTWMVGPWAPSLKYAIAQCSHCENLIPRVKWTDEMDEAFQRFKKGLKTPARFYRGLWVFPLILAAFAGAIFLVAGISNNRQKHNAASVKQSILSATPGQVFQVINSSNGQASYMYFKVERSEGDSLYLLPSVTQRVDMVGWDEVPVEPAAYRSQAIVVSKSRSASEDLFLFDSAGVPHYGMVYGVFKDGELTKKY